MRSWGFATDGRSPTSYTVEYRKGVSVANKNWEKASVDEIDDEMGVLRGERERITEELRELARARDVVVHREQAEQLIDGMSDEQLETLAQVVRAEGIETRESVNGGRAR